jgi:hypothetical protein
VMVLPSGSSIVLTIGLIIKNVLYLFFFQNACKDTYFIRVIRWE